MKLDKIKKIGLLLIVSTVLGGGCVPQLPGRGDSNVPTVVPTPTYNPEQAAGGTTELSLNYTKADYENARSQGKVIVLYFYANWCPTCRAQQPANDAAFSQLRNDPGVAIFVSNFNDSEETGEDKTLQREFDIPYQHTFVILNSKGEVSYKYTGQLSAEQIIAEVEKARVQ